MCKKRVTSRCRDENKTPRKGEIYTVPVEVGSSRDDKETAAQSDSEPGSSEGQNTGGSSRGPEGQAEPAPPRPVRETNFTNQRPKLPVEFCSQLICQFINRGWSQMANSVYKVS